MILGFLGFTGIRKSLYPDLGVLTSYQLENHGPVDCSEVINGYEGNSWRVVYHNIVVSNGY